MSAGEWIAIGAGAVAVSNVGVVLIRKYVDSTLLKDHHEATDPMMACVGTLFAILLGFMVANAMTRFEEARLNVQEEAGAAGDVFRLARSLPPPTNMTIMHDCVDYLTVVTDQEFHLMEDGKMSDRGWQIYSDLWQHCTSYDPKTQGQSNLHQGMVQAMTKLGECRRARNSQLSYRLPPVLWNVVVAGACAIVVFTFFFGVKSLRLQLLMTSIVTIVLVLNIYLLACFDTPFNGDVRVSLIPFQDNKVLFQKALDNEQKGIHN